MIYVLQGYEIIMLRYYKNVVFEKNNICRFRGLILPNHFEKNKDKLLSIIKDQNGKTNGEIITVTYGAEGERLDMEILIPCNKKIDLNPPFSFEINRKIENCLLIEYVGYIDCIQDEVNEINQYFADNSLKAISKAHYVAKETSNIFNSETPIYIYIGVE